MRFRNIYLLLPVFLPLFGISQNLSFAGGNYPVAFSTDPGPSEILPPRVFQPLIQADGAGLVFQWERPVVPSGTFVEYEFLLTAAGETLYSATTTKNELRLDGTAIPALKYNRPYRIVINTRVTDQHSSYVVPGENNALEFTWLPECTVPKNVEVKLLNQEPMLSWEGPLPAAEGIRYEIEYFAEPAANAIGKQTVLVSSGTNSLNLKGMEPGFSYTVRIRKLCDGAGASFENASDWVEMGPVSLDDLSAKDAICGGSYSAPGCPGTSAAANATFSVLRIRGFNITVLTIYRAGESPSYWEGTGIMQLPFQQKKVKVKFRADDITTSGVICDGTVEGLSDQPAYWPNLYPPASPTNQICLPAGTHVGFDPNTGLWMPDSTLWNPQGFGADSDYVKQPPYPGYSPGAPFDTSGTYDPWGFDASCKNKDTGTEFDLNGCSCYGTDIYGNPCQHTVPPYYWLNDTTPLGSPTQAGLAFANQQKTAIQATVTAYLNTTHLQILVKVDSIGDHCDSLRQIMRGLVQQLNYDSNFIFGPAKEYFSAGMHLNFSARPQPLGTYMERDARTIRLENEHVNLYDCDVDDSKNQDYKKVIEYFQAQPGYDSLVDAILEMVKRFTPEEVSKYSHPDTLAAWVKLRVAEQIEAKFQELYGGSYGAVDKTWPDAAKWCAEHNKPRTTQQKQARWDGSAALALGPVEDPLGSQALWQSMDIRDADLSFEFAQGFDNIFGVDRGYFLESIADERRKAQAFPEFYTTHDTILQPIEIPKWIGGRYYYVYLDKVKVENHPSGGGSYTGSATVDVYLLMDIPTLDQKVVLKALGVNFNPTGPDVVPIQLELNNDIALRMSNAIRVILKKSSQTHIKVDCDGFAGISLLGDVEVCRNYLVPLAPTSLEPLPDPRRVTGHFFVQLNHWSEFYATLTFDRFAVAGYEDFKWVIDTVAFDFSDDISPSGFPPIGYSSPFANAAGFSKAWQGVYIQNLAVHLPKQFSKNNQTTSVGVERVLIDERGFSGTATVTTPLISIGEGSAGGWAFSVDQFRLTFIGNELADGGFGGKINVPIISGAACNPNGPVVADDCFDYAAKILPGNAYQLTVSIPQGQHYCADLWKAGTVIIDPNSMINLTVKNGSFDASATLHGRVTINAQVGGIELTMPDTLRFQNLIIRNKSPYFSVGTWQMPTSVNCQIGGFGISVDDLGMGNDNSDNEYFLSFGLGISLTKEGGSAEDSVGVTARAKFRIYGELAQPDGRQRWRFKEVKLTSITVNASFPGAKIKGELAFYNDNAGTWGKGFRGLLDAKFEKIELEIKALAQFGRNNTGGTFKYFFVDALIVLPAGIPIFPPLQLKGFGGGVYHHMARASSVPASLPLNTTPVPDLPANLGVSLSGEHYVPDVTAGLGLKATVLVSVPKEQAFNANLSMEILFNAKTNGGGIRAFYFDGMAFFMKDPKMNGAPSFNIDDPAVLKASAHIDVQFTPTFKLHGSLATYLKVGDVLTGTGDHGKVTDTEFHIEPGKWYINMGTPSNPQGIRLSLGGTSLAEIKMYMDLGKNIPPMPPLPAKVQALTGMGNFMANETLRATGNGFAFGSSLTIGSGEKKCLPGCDKSFYFYSNLSASAGFDLMLQDYGDAVCSNLGNEPLGINGWYASGQAYMLLEAGVGVGFKVFGAHKEFEILEVGAAAALQMKLPNPFWAKGAVGGKFSVMGGLVKGNINFGFTIGQSCQISGGTNPEDNLLIINTLEPINGAEDVDVAIHPGVSFNLPIGKTFEQSNATFKTELAYATLKYNGYTLPVEAVWKDDKMYLELIPKIMLPANDSVTFEVKVNIYKNGTPQTPDVKTAGFHTGSSYEEIPDFNVKASYPIDGQYNFYPSEWMEQKGYILLNANQPDLLASSAQSGRLKVRITPSSGTSFEKPVNYVASQAKLEFPMPAADLPLQTLFKLELIKKGDVTGNENLNQNKGSSVEPSASGDKVLFDVYFRTSQYPRFFDKVGALGATQSTSVETEFGSFKKPVTIEPFDEYEIMGSGSDDLVQMVAKLDQTSWYSSYVKPIVYANYAGSQPNSWGMWVDERPAEPYGRIPYKAVILEAGDRGASLRVTAEHFSSGVAPVAGAAQFVNYLVPTVVAQDYHDLCDDVWAYVAQSCVGVCAECMSYSCCAYIPNYPNCGVNCNGYTSPIAFREAYIQNQLPTEALRNMYRLIWLNTPPAGTYPAEASYHLPGLGNTTSIHSLNLQKN